MQGQVIRNAKSIKTIRPDTKAVVLRFRPTIMNATQLLKYAQNVKTIYISESIHYHLGKATMDMIKEAGIKLKTSDKIYQRPARSNSDEVEITEMK